MKTKTKSAIQSFNSLTLSEKVAKKREKKKKKGPETTHYKQRFQPYEPPSYHTHQY
jgi:hypothetical protein